ncbi:DUF4365 domain-containing protein [Kitasatospora sp. NPDC004614]|uniref:DUF4365 domain-containing protein n=1 Tax=unclassified Kitasatospora TaxID=2633591 RepID=UPI0036AFD96B
MEPNWQGAELTKVRSTRVLERAGVNQFRSLMESAGHIVQEIDGGNDHGEDCYLSLTRGGERTGEIVAVQIKSGETYRRPVGYGIRCDRHIRDWTLSRIPVIGVVYDPELQKLFWVNMSEFLLDQVSLGRTPKSVPIGEDAILDSETIHLFIFKVSRFISENDRTGYRPPPSIRSSIGSILGRLGDAKSDVDVPIGGVPYVLGVPSVDFHERNPKFDGRALKACLYAAMLCAYALAGPGLYRAAELESGGEWLRNGWLWLVCYFGTLSYLYLASVKEPRRKSARPLLWSAQFLLMLGLYIGIGEQTSAWPVNPTFRWIFIDIMPAIAQAAILYLGGHYAAKERDRRRRLRAAYPSGVPKSDA